MGCRSVLAAIGCGGAALATLVLACSSYDEDAPQPTEAGAEAGASVPLNDAGTSADSPVGEKPDSSLDASDAVYGLPDVDGLYPNCPRTKAASSFEAHTTFQVASAPLATEERDYPFGVITDSTSVYWVSALAKKADSDENTQAYNGAGNRGRIHRAPKTSAAPLPWKDTLLLQSDQAMVNDLALDGKFVYWAAGSSGGVQMRRVLRTCSTPCTPEDVGPNASTQPIVRLRRAAPGLLAGLTKDGVAVTFSTATSTWDVTSLVGRSGGFAVRNDDAFASRIDDANIGRVELGPPAKVTDVFATIAPLDGGAAGTGLLATDCRSLFAYRTDRSVWRLDIGASTTHVFTPWAQPNAHEVFDIFADGDFVYIGGADAAGLYAVSIATRETRQLGTGSYWRVTADEGGVFAGEHTNSGPNTGAMIRVE